MTDHKPTANLAADPLGHLMLRDTRTKTEREAAEAAERARRKGRWRKDWWKREPAK